MAEKVTRMLIKLDLQCCRCYKKIKKILCKYPQIRDQIYDEKQNSVLITVVCCSPKKIRQKIICKGGETVQSVDILPDKPKEPAPAPAPAAAPKKDPAPPKETPKKKEEPIDPDKGSAVDVQSSKGYVKLPAPALAPAPAPAPVPTPKVLELAPSKPPQPGLAPLPPKGPERAVGYPLLPMDPMVGVCWCPCYEGYGGGPCYYHGQGRPAMCYDGCGRPGCQCQSGNRGYYGSRCDYFSEENPTGCTVM